MPTKKELEFQLKKRETELRKCRKAIRLAHRSDWMVTCDWAETWERDEMWQEVKKLSGLRSLGFKTLK